MPAMQGEVYVEAPRRAALPFTLGDALDDGLAGLRKHGIVLTVAQVLTAVPGAGLALAFHFALGEPRLFSRAYFERTLVLAACGAALGALFRGGLARMALDAARGKSPRLSDLLRGMRHFPAMLALEVAHVLVLAASIPLLFVPYLLVWTGLALAPFAIVDRDEGFLGAVRFAWTSARGERWHLFGFLVATAIVEYLGALACCVGAFPAEALAGVATAHVYRRFAGEE